MMADEKPIPPTPEPKPEPDPTPPPTQTVSKEQYDDVNARLRAAEQALAALNANASRQVTQPATSPGREDLAAAIAQQTGMNVDEVRNYLPFYQGVFGALAAPIIQQYQGAIATLADNLADIRARQTYPDFKDYEPEIKAEREARFARNEYMSPTDAYHLVRAKNLPKEIERAREQAL